MDCETSCVFSGKRNLLDQEPKPGGSSRINCIVLLIFLPPPGRPGRASDCEQVYRQPAADQRSQVRPAAVRARHLLRPTHHLSLRGGACQVRTRPLHAVLQK